MQLISQTKDELQNFNEAKSALKTRLTQEKTLMALQALAKEKLKDFKGKSVGYVSLILEALLVSLTKKKALSLSTLFLTAKKKKVYRYW